MSTIKDSARKTFRVESQAVADLSELLTDDFDHAVGAVLGCSGKLIVTGMGKSGIIGRKISATLSSTGTPSSYMHPGDAYHGDLGMVCRQDIILAISNSGQTDEVLKLIPFFQSNGNMIVAMTGNPASTLAKNASYHLNIYVNEEACPLSLAPTSSTTASLAMGDAFAVALMNERGFKAVDFARFHPGGTLGRRLLMKVGDVMRKSNLPVVAPGMNLGEVIIAVSDARLGVAIVVDKEKIVGVVTDGDVRRAMQRYRRDFFDKTAGDIMTLSPKTIGAQARIVDAEEQMRSNKIHSLIVVNELGGLVGMVELYDLMMDGGV